MIISTCLLLIALIAIAVVTEKKPASVEQAELIPVRIDSKDR